MNTHAAPFPGERHLNTHAAPLPAIEAAEIVGESSMTARKTIATGDPYLAGHFPGAPVYPGVFFLESAVQAVRVLYPGEDPRLVRVRSLRVTAPVRPGDELLISVDTTAPGGTDSGDAMLARITCALADGTPVARLRLDFTFDEAANDRAR